MRLAGRRIHIVGSAAPDADEAKLAYAHELVTSLVRSLVREGATFLLQFHRQPFLKDRIDGPAITFDWTVAEAIAEAIRNGAVPSTTSTRRLIATYATAKTDSQIPPQCRDLYDFLRNSNAVEMEFIEPGWSSGAYRRDRLAQIGDIMIGLSGGEGVEHQAVIYAAKGKPIIPVDLQLGASQHDGSGGAARLFDKALHEPIDFFRVIDGESASELLDRIRTRDATTPVTVVVEHMNRLLGALRPPEVFYVRLLNSALPEFASVEQFFRQTLDPFIESLGYSHFEMGKDKHEFAWMNEAIFGKLHHSSIVLADLTGLRPNCFMELGYAFGNRQSVIVTARDDTKISFDAASLDAFFWSQTDTPAESQAKLQKHWDLNVNRPHLVKVRKAR